MRAPALHAAKRSIPFVHVDVVAGQEISPAEEAVIEKAGGKEGRRRWRIPTRGFDDHVDLVDDLWVALASNLAGLL